MQELYFVTGNERKFADVKEALSELNPYIELKRVDVDLPEIQSLDVEEIAIRKAKEAWRLIQKPLLIDDGGIYLERYNNFPGPLSRYVYEGIGLEGFWLLAKDDPRAYFLNCIVYCAGEDTCKSFTGITKGSIVEPVAAKVDPKMPFIYVFVPEGSEKTYSELKGTPEGKALNHRIKSLRQFTQWLKDNPS